MVNNTELPLLCSIQIDFTKNYKVVTSLFYITLIELPFTLLGNEGLNKLLPNWSFENLTMYSENQELTEN